LQIFGRIILTRRKLDKIHINDMPPFGLTLNFARVQ